MLVWLVAGVLLGLVLSHLAGKLVRSPTIELTYATLVGIMRRQPTGPLQDRERRTSKPARWKAAAGKSTLM